ncbi:MAG: mitochondrial fission ELM1 family protein [Alphaproteobacteria bacterium]|nr:mitochondrial fission ELM1 family protein [Alphaproteobacteria bacterium]
MDKNSQKLTCWVVSEGMAGTENQCLGVAKALGITPVIKRISLNLPWNILSPYVGFEMNATFTPKLEGPWPDLVIASGRKAVAAARFIKKKSKGKTFTVFLQDPKVLPSHFDLVAVPFHDKMRGQNVLITDGAPNKITLDSLNSAKNEFSVAFSKLNAPRIAVLIGGTSKAHKMTTEVTKKLCHQLNNIDASLMITASRRTGEENLKVIQKECGNDKNFIWDGSNKNPYLGILAWADYILVTADSTSMISDAATTGKPTYIIPLDGGSSKFDIFHTHLKNIGAVREFSGSLEKWSYAPLTDAADIAHVIKEKMGV